MDDCGFCKRLGVMCSICESKIVVMVSIPERELDILRARIAELEAPPSEGEIESVANVVRVEVNQWELDMIDNADVSYTSIEHEITKAAIKTFMEGRR